MSLDYYYKAYLLGAMLHHAMNSREEDIYWDELHYELHSLEYPIKPEHRRLDCEVCCGLPPWDWTITTVNMYCHLDMHDEKFNIEYLAFNWRKNRVYFESDVPWYACRECGKYRQCANFKPNQPETPIYRHLEYYKENSLCPECLNSASDSLHTNDIGMVLKEIDQSIKTMRKGKTA